MALFLVAIAPACVFGAKARAASARFFGTPASPSGSSEEDERETEPAKLKAARHAAGSPSTIPVRLLPPRPVITVAVIAIARPSLPRISRAVLPWLHQSRFSERLLI